MSPEVFVDILSDALWLVILIVSMAIIPSLIVGLIVSIFQAATSINEQTLSFTSSNRHFAGPDVRWSLVNSNHNGLHREALSEHSNGYQLMEYPLQQLLQVIADFMLPFARVSAMMFIMVAFGAKNIPTRVKAAFCAAFIVMIMPVVPPVKDVNLMSLNLVVQMIQQIVIGLAIGFISQIFVQAFVTAGQILATQTGLGFAAMADPANGVSVPAIGQFYLILATLLFLVYDGHLIMFQMVVFSFESLPINGQWMDVNKYWQVAEFGGWIIVTALAITLAPVTAMLVVNIAFGVLTRTAPQLNIFSIGMPISMLAGLLIMWLTMDTFLFHFNLNWQHGIEYTCKLIGC